MINIRSETCPECNAPCTSQKLFLTFESDIITTMLNSKLNGMEQQIEKILKLVEERAKYLDRKLKDEQSNKMTQQKKVERLQEKLKKSSSPLLNRIVVVLLVMLLLFVTFDLSRS